MSPTGLSLKLLRAEGFTCAVVEAWVPHTKFRRDLFGFGDILAVNHQTQTILIVQTTTLTNVAARLAKARNIPALTIWLRAGGKFEVHGWCNKAGKAAVKRIDVREDSLGDVFLAIPKRRRGRKAPSFKSIDLFELAK